LAEWFYDDGIGEERAILVDQGRIIEAHIERKDGIKAGLVAQAQLVTQLVARKRGIAALKDGAQVLLSPLPAGLTEGGSLLVEVTREAVHETSRSKLPVARAAADGASAMPAPSLLQRISTGTTPIKTCHAHEADHFEEYGWGELIEEARSGLVAFGGGSLLIAVTPAMTLIDVDGDIPALLLALAAATASAHAIRRLGIQGSIGIDFPNVADKHGRQAVAEALDHAMTQPCERTAVNGFGFLQLVTRRQRPSMLELIQGDRINAHLYGLLRRAERDRAVGEMILVANPAIASRLSASQPLLEMLSKRTGRLVTLRSDPAIDMDGGYVE
jgi:Ribonuclease E/G family